METAVMNPAEIVIEGEEDADEDLALELGEGLGQAFPVVVRMEGGRPYCVSGAGLVRAACLWNDANREKAIQVQCIIQQRMEPHRFALLFPPMSKMERAELEEDIRAHGFDDKQPITVYQDQILDGRNRYEAALAVDAELVFRQFVGDDGAALDFVLRANLHRRHLSTSQRAAVAADLATLRKGANASNEAPSQGDAAKVLNISRASVQRAAGVKREAPDLHEQVKAGEITVGAAEKKARERRGPYELRDKKKPPPRPTKSETRKRSEALADEAVRQLEGATSDAAPRVAARKASGEVSDKPPVRIVKTAADIVAMMEDSDLGDDEFTWREFGKWILGEQEYLVQ